MKLNSIFFALEDWFAKLSIPMLRLFTLLVLVVILSFFFSDILFHPTCFSFANSGDDFKNYFVLKTYLDQPAKEGYFHYTFMNYPFGETIYFTDISPSIALFLRWLKINFAIDSAYLVYLFDVIIIVNFIVASQLIISILKRFLFSKTLLFSAALILPFTNPQAIRLFLGTENLSLSSVLLLVIFLLLKLIESAKYDSFKRGILLSFFLTITIIFCSFIHLYFILILLVFVTPWLFVEGVRLYLADRKWHLIVTSFVISLISLGFVLFTLMITDPFYHLRKDGANGYDWEPWKLSFGSLYSSYNWNFSSFIFNQTLSLNYESLCYLGPIVLYSFLLFLCFFVFLKIRKKPIFFEAKNDTSLTLRILFWVSFISLSVALGRRFCLYNDHISIGNFLNPFDLAKLFTQKFTHFRCIGRFAWIFFWTSNFVAILFFDSILKRRKPILLFIIYAMLFLSFMDSLYMGQMLRKHITPNMLSPNGYSDKVLAIEAKVKNNYDAMIVLPFFQTGSEDYPNTVDPTFQTQQSWMELSNALQLPMTSFMMSRTPLNFNISQLNFYRTAKYDSLLAPLMRGKNILIIKNDEFFSMINKNHPSYSEDTKLAIYNGIRLPETLGLKPFDSVGYYKLYSWKVPD